MYAFCTRKDDLLEKFIGIFELNLLPRMELDEVVLSFDKLILKSIAGSFYVNMEAFTVDNSPLIYGRDGGVDAVVRELCNQFVSPITIGGIWSEKAFPLATYFFYPAGGVQSSRNLSYIIQPGVIYRYVPDFRNPVGASYCTPFRGTIYGASDLRST